MSSGRILNINQSKVYLSSETDCFTSDLILTLVYHQIFYITLIQTLTSTKYFAIYYLYASTISTAEKLSTDANFCATCLKDICLAEIVQCIAI